MYMEAEDISHAKYQRVRFHWSEAYDRIRPSTDRGHLYAWVLNRPGPNVVTGTISADQLTERVLYSTDGNHGGNHQPYLWDQITADFGEYRCYGAQYKLTVKNIGTRNTSDTDHIYVAVGVSQEKYSVAPTALVGFDTDHQKNQILYIEGRHPEWKRLTLSAQESRTFSGHVDMRRFLKRHRYNNQNEGLEAYSWLKADAGPTETTVIGDEVQNQPYYGWGSATVSNVTLAGPADATNVVASYGRAPQCCFLFLSAVCDQSGTDKIFEVSLSVNQKFEFRRLDPQYIQS